MDLPSETDSSSKAISESEVDTELDPSSGSGFVESDNFSETPSEFYAETSQSEDVKTDTDQEGRKTKRKRKTFLAYQRKREKKPSKRQETTDVKESVIVDVDADVNIVSDDDNVAMTEDVTQQNEPMDTEAEKASIDHSPIAFATINNLKLLLDDAWSFDFVRSCFLRLMHHNDHKNAVVDRCLYWDCAKAAVGIFVHGFGVPEENRIFYSKAVPIKDNVGSISDYLGFLANKVLKSSICSGIENYEEFWDSYEGTVDQYSAPPCYRSLQCSLLVEENRKTCQNCRSDLQIFERECKREERKLKLKEKGKKFYAQDKDLSKEEIKEKKDKWKMKCKLAERRAKRLQKRLDRLQIKLDDVMRDDLIGILKANENNMTDIQRLFWDSQKAALCSNDKRGLRWHPMMIRVALRLRSLSAGAVEFLRDSKIMVLPSDRTLFDYSHYIDPKEGCQKEVIEFLKEKLKKGGPEEHNCYVNVMFDEMHIRSGLVTKRSTGELVGYTNLSTVDEELQKLSADLESKSFKPKLAKKVLVFLAQGLTSKVQDVVAIHSTDDLYAVQLYDRAWEIIYHLEEAGIKVLCLTCDGAAVNRKFIRMHSSADSSAQEVYSTKNLASGDGRILYFIIDPPHLLKTIRNALANSFSHRKSRKLWKNGEFLSWKVLEKIYDLTKKDKYVSHKLTKAHITLSSFSCMTVSYATQALSNSVANTIEKMANLEAMEMFDTEELVKFIRIMNKFFDCVNGKQEAGQEVRNPDLAAFTDPNDSRLAFLSTTFLDYFEDWKREVKNRPGIFSANERAQMIVSYQALESLQITVKSIVRVIKFMLEDAKASAVNARLLNQDPLEQYFGKVRRQQGDNRNPTLKATLDTSFNLRAQGLVAMASKKGNTEVQEAGGLEVDDTLLPKRHKKS